MCTRVDRKLFNNAHQQSKMKIQESLIHELLFADDAASVTQTEAQLRCNDFY